MNCKTQRERRFARRHDLTIPLKHRMWKSNLLEEPGESLNISENGVYFATNSVLEQGDTVEVRFQMPEEVVPEPSGEWVCTGQVVRVDRMGGVSGLLGVGVRFDCYEVTKPQGRTTIQFDAASFRLGLFSRERVQASKNTRR